MPHRPSADRLRVGAEYAEALASAEAISLATSEVLPPTQIILILGQYGSDEEVCEAGLHMLHHASLQLVRHAEAGAAVAKLTVSTMVGQSESLPVQKYGCFIIGTLAFQNYLGEMSIGTAIGTVLRAMEGFQKVEQVIGYGARALTHLLLLLGAAKPGNWVDMESRIFEQATLAKRRFPGDSGCQEWSGRVLERLEAENGEEGGEDSAPASGSPLRSQTFSESGLRGSMLDAASPGGGGLRSASFQA